MSRQGSRYPAAGTRQRNAVSVVVFLGIVSARLIAGAQTTRPFDEEPLKSGSTPALPSSSSNGPIISPSHNAMDIGRVALALAIVLFAIFLLRWLARQFVRTGLPASKPIKVLSRSILSPKQQLLLLQIGKRLVVVGDSGGSMNPLCEITDPDEVASLIGQSREDHVVTKSFGKFFGRAKEPFADAGPAEATEAGEAAQNPEIAEMSRDIGGLMEKVQLMRSQFKRS